jgi:biopolymer transport protein ExbB
MLANILVELFRDGGYIMYPIAVCIIVTVAVVGERVVWWIGHGRRRDPARLEKLLGALEAGDFREASALSKGSEDPVIKMIYHGMNHVNSSLEGALQVAAGVELQKAGRFLSVMDTMVTMGPLIGLLGTVTGIMKSFAVVGGSELAVQAVTGGIAEALIATAFGLGIAIVCLVPYNYYTGRLQRLQFELETAATNVQVMVNAAKQRGFETIEFRREAVGS